MERDCPVGARSRPRPWKSAELAEQAWVRPLTAEQVDGLDAALRAAAARGLTAETVTRDDFPLPGAVAAAVAEWSSQLRAGAGFVLIRGLPVEGYSEDEASLLYVGLGLHLGRTVPQSPAGQLLGHVRDTGAAKVDPRVRLYQTNFHVDYGELVGLLCLQTAKSGGASRIASSLAIVEQLFAEAPHLGRVLFEPFPLDRRNEEEPGQLPYVPVPVCRFAGGMFRVFYHGDYFRSAIENPRIPDLDDLQVEALETFQRIAESPDFYYDMELRQGDVQLLSNDLVVHARTEYVDHDDPARKRHLLRLWLNDWDGVSEPRPMSFEQAALAVG
jgi:hypothetical protein